jgi:vacuolar-type H+-ATPase subunit E/Vma4
MALGRVLEKARDLARQVRSTADRVHCEAVESRRLIGIAKSYSEKGRALSKAGRQGARAVRSSIGESIETVGQAERRLSGKEKA